MPDDQPEELHAGDHVILDDDDWTVIGQDFVVVDVEPVAGSTQCIVADNGDARVVNRLDLRRRN